MYALTHRDLLVRGLLTLAPWHNAHADSPGETTTKRETPVKMLSTLLAQAIIRKTQGQDTRLLARQTIGLSVTRVPDRGYPPGYRSGSYWPGKRKSGFLMLLPRSIVRTVLFLDPSAESHLAISHTTAHYLVLLLRVDGPSKVSLAFAQSSRKRFMPISVKG